MRSSRNGKTPVGKYDTCSATLPRRIGQQLRLFLAGRSSGLQAGPACAGGSYWAPLPNSLWREPVRQNAPFVPAYRCGAAPDSHRVPSWRRPVRRRAWATDKDEYTRAPRKFPGDERRTLRRDYTATRLPIQQHAETSLLEMPV